MPETLGPGKLGAAHDGHGKRVDAPTGTETVGHEWDGIEELNTPLPRWWLWSFYASIVFSIGYMVLYPTWPMIHGATEGVLGWSSRGQLEEVLAAEQAKKAPMLKKLAAMPIEQLPGDPALMQAAIEAAPQDLAAQADPNADSSALVKRYPKAQVRDFDGDPDRLTEMDAMVAYLQMLGTLVDFKAAEAHERDTAPAKAGGK